MRTYTELRSLLTFKERFDYLALGGLVGEATFGSARYLNQNFYRTRTWKELRDEIIIRDSVEGYPCDLGCPERPIRGKVVIHHIEPITVEDILYESNKLLDPDNLITTCDLTHQALHFSNYNLIPPLWAPRVPNDTCPWRCTDGSD